MKYDVKTAYVLGFAFDGYGNVILINKTRPKWQAGLLNGVGGHIDDTDPSSLFAMVREFKEETGITTTEDDWVYKLTLKGDEWDMDVFCYIDEAQHYLDLDGKETDTDETISIMKYTDIMANSACMSQIGWLIGMCLDPGFPTTHYEILFKGR